MIYRRLHRFVRRVALVSAALAGLAASAFGNSCTSNVVSGNWNASGSWTTCGGVTPTAADTVTILNGQTITLNTSATVLSVNVNNGGTLTTDNNSRVLTLAATSGTPMTVGATGTFTPGNSTVVISGNAALTLTSGAITFNNLTLSPTITVARTYTFGTGAITVNGAFMVNPTAASVLAFTLNMGAPITVGGLTTLTRTTSATTAFSATASNFPLTTGSLSVLAGATFTPLSSTVTLTGVSGTVLTGGGTFTAGTSRVKYTGDGAITLTSANAFTFYDLELAPTITAGRTYTFGTTAPTVSHNFIIDPGAASAQTLAVNMATALTVTGITQIAPSGSAAANLSTTASNFALTTGNLDIESGGTLTANGSTITLNGTTGVLLTDNGTFTAGTSTVIMNPNANVTITAGTPTLNNLTLSPTITAAHAYTFGSGAVSISGAFMINPTAASALAFTLNMGGPITVGGLTTITRTTSATTAVTTTASNYPLTTGSLSVLAGGTLTANGSTITITGTSGTLLTGGGTFTAGTSSVVFAGDGTATLTSNTAFTFYDLELAPTLTAGRTYTFGTSALTVNHNFLIDPNAASALALAVNLGAAAAVTGTTTISPAGSATASMSTTGSNFALTTGNLDIESGGTLTANASTLTLNGTTGTLFTNKGTFTPGTSTVVMNPNASITTTSGAITFNNLTISPTITVAQAYTFGSGAIGVNGAFMINPTAASVLAFTVNMGAPITVTGLTTVTRTTSATNTLTTTASNYPLTTGSLSVLAGGTLTANDSHITITGTSGTLFTGGGTFTAGTSTVTFSGDGSPTLTSGALTFYDLELAPTITGARAYTFGTTALAVNHNLSITPTAASALALTVNLGAATTVTGTTTIDPAGSATTSVTTSASNFALTTANLDIEAGGSLTANASTLTLNGTTGTLFINNGTFTQGTSTVVMNPNASVQVTSGTITFATLSLTPTITAGRVYTFGTGPITATTLTVNPTAASALNLGVVMGDAVTVTGTLSVTRTTSATSSLDTTTNNYPLTAGLISVASGGTLTANGSTVTITGTTSPLMTVSGSFNAGTSTVIMTANAAVTLTAGTAFTLNNLVLNPTITVARTYTFGTATTMTGDLTVNPNAASALALTVNLAAALNVGGSILLTRTGSATDGFSTTTSNFALTASDLDIETGATLTANASTLTLNGTGPNPLLTRNGTFTQGTSSVVMNPDADVTLTSGTVTFNNLTLSPTMTTGRTYTFGDGAINAAAFTLNPSGSGNLNVVMGAALTATGLVTVSDTGSAASTLDTGANYALSAGQMTIAAGDQFNANGSAVTLTGTTSPVLTVNGTMDPGTSNVTFTGNAALTLTSGGVTFNTLTLNPTITVARTYTFGAGPMTVVGDFMINPNAASALALTVNFGSSVTVNGLTTVTRSGSATATMSTTASNFALATGQLNIATSGTLTANGSTITFTSSSSPLFTRVGTFTQGASVVDVRAGANATLNSGTVTFNDLVIDTPGLTQKLGAAVTIANLTVSSGTLDDGGFQITGTAARKLTLSSQGELSLGSAATATTFPTNYSAANILLNAASTVTYNAGVAQTISGTPTYGNLELATPSGTPTKTLGAAVSVAGDLTIGANNTLSTSASNFAVTLAGNYTNNGTLTVNTASFTFTGASAETLNGTLNGSSAFNTVLLNGSGSWTPTSATLINGNLTVTKGTLAGTSDITVVGAVAGTGSTGAINLTGGTFTQRVAAAQTFGTNVAGANDWVFNNLAFSNSSAANRTVTLNGTGTGAIRVNGTLTVGNAGDTNATTVDNLTNDRTLDTAGVAITSKGVLSASNTTPLTDSGDWSNQGTFTANGGTVTFDLAGQQNVSGQTTFANFQAVTSGCTLSFAAGSTTTVTGALTLTGITLNSSANGTAWYLTFSGTTQNLGSLSVRDSNASSGNRLFATATSTNVSGNVNWDFGAPGKITTLAAFQGTLGATVKLTWLAPGDDGATGTLINSTFTVEYTTDTSFASGAGWDPTAGLPSDVSRLQISTTNVAAGAACETTVGSLISGGTYYVRVWTNDQGSQYSPLSNGATNWATVIVLGLNLSQTSIDFGSLNPGSTNVISTPIVVTNTGNVVQRVQISIANPAVWSPTTGVPSTDQFRLTGLFRTATPASSDFDTVADVMTGTPAIASSTIYARAADPDTEKGINVNPGETRNLWFRVEMPPISSTVTPQVVTLTGTAVQ